MCSTIDAYDGFFVCGSPSEYLIKQAELAQITNVIKARVRDGWGICSGLRAEMIVV